MDSKIEDSILLSIEKLLNSNDSYFDVDIIIYINSAFMRLNQLGVGPKKIFTISDTSATWKNFLGENEDSLPMIQTFICLYVKLLFDPPQSSVLMNHMKDELNKYEWLLNVSVDPLTD